MRAAVLGVVVACGGSGTNAPPDVEVEPFTEVRLTVANQPGSGVVVAYQDGSGGWTKVESQTATYTLPIFSNRYGALVSCTSPGAIYVGLAFFQVSEMPALTMKSPCTDPLPSTFAGTITGGDGSFVFVSVDPQHAALLAPRDPKTFELEGASTADLAVVRFSADPTTGPVQEVDRIAIVRGQLPVSDLAVDLAAGTAPTVVDYLVPVEPLDEQAILQASVVTERNTILLGQDARQGDGGPATLRVFGLPASLELATDRYRVGTVIARGGRSAFAEERIFESVTEVAGASFERMAPFVGSVEADGLLPAIRFTPHPTAQGYTVDGGRSGTPGTAIVSATFSATWLGSDDVLRIPDVSEVVEIDEGIDGEPFVTAQAEQSTLGVTDVPLPFTPRSPGPPGSVRTSAGL